MQMPAVILDALERGAAVIAAGPRAARALHLDFAEEQHARGRDAWPTPAIFDWKTWLRHLWREYSFLHPEAPLLLSALQENMLWKRMQGEDAALVVSPESMAALAQQAWQLLGQYEAHRSRNTAWEQADAEHFRLWAAAFDDECRRRSWISESHLESRLAAALDGLPLPEEIVLAGFDRMRPARQRLLTALTARGLRVRELAPESPATRQLWVTAADRRSEIHACAQWTRDLLQTAGRTPRIGIIVTSIDAVRGEMERIFRHMLMPQSEDILADPAAMPFEFSLGRPLAQTPVIRAASLLLHWAAGPLREEEISWLMLSGFVAEETALLSLARFDAELRNSPLPSPELSLERYARMLPLAKYPALAPVRTRLNELVQAAAANQLQSQERAPATWTELAQHLLRTAGWPGPRPADSVQFQALKRWEHLLDEVALLDYDGTRMRCDAFLRLLGRQAEETIFAPESRNAPVQIMGPLEASGQQFDAVWFLGADESSWPMRGRPHPLLPLAVQRQYGMPHAAPETDPELAQIITRRLLASAAQIVFSYPQRDKDGDLRPSPVIAALFAPGTMPLFAADLWPAEEVHHAAALEEIADTSGTLPWPQEKTAGGSEVLRSQAACPFQAFATKRLRAEAWKSHEWGLSAAQRGNLLHDVMRRLWSGSEPDSLRTHDDLLAAFAQNRLDAILDLHIAAAFAPLVSSASDDSWMQAYLISEQQRLHMRLEEWLQIEARRQPFTVEACEQKLHDVHVGDLRLNLRADRIDRLPDDSRLLIDYKTGEVSAAAWRGERPEEPQLPLYAVYGNVPHVSGLLFAQIRAGKTGFQGRVRNAAERLDATLKATSTMMKEPYTEAMRDGWEEALRHLAEDFLRGEASVDPRDSKVCLYCPLPGLCRIAESERDPGEDEDGEEVEDRDENA
ncbi:PD-(D/E)XK nuclease family protein [Paracidobacterium acidisoli]|nr:PD-(D/E)XK nuclease family protein [Paracidobacterium acidisoli]MBT9329928.1 PD-(D/E)XK nuclease family protein [Paracidobacterium acidisoli]